MPMSCRTRRITFTGRVERIPEHFVLHDVVAEIGDDLEYELSADGTITYQPRLLGSRVRVARARCEYRVNYGCRRH